MSRRKHLAPVASFNPPAGITLTPADWRKIERAWGQPIAKNKRANFVEATQEFVVQTLFDTHAASLSDDVRPFLSKIRASTDRLSNLISAPNTEAGAMYARILLSNRIQDDRIGLLPAPRLREPLNELTGILASVTEACDQSLQELKDPAYTLIKGGAWDRWIRALFHVLTGSKFRSGQRGQLSRFTAMIATTQECLPSAYKRHGYSMSDSRALERAVSRALRSGTKTKLKIS